MKKILIIYVYSILSFIYASSLEFYENSYAVLIGINNYQSESMNDLGLAVADAESVTDLLTTKLHFPKENVRVLLNEEATKDNINNTLFQIAELAGPNDRILIYYAGHGETYPLKNGGELGYLIPFQ